MRTGKEIKHIVIHCSAGYGDVKAIKAYWKRIGWKQVGYHILIDEDGTMNNLAPFTSITNGVKGFNNNSIHISYIGGVERMNVNKAKDTRTDNQKESLLVAIEQALQWVHDYGGAVRKLKIIGHRDLSPDLNNNGTIESNERIKECPSFNAIPEYQHLLNKL
jgi:N-acetylmuramoyl-L-alanine amidase